VGQPLLPVAREQAGLFRNRIDVIGDRQRHDVGFQSIDHGPGLLAAATVRLFHHDLLPLLLLPVRGEGPIEFLIEFTGRIVGDIQ